MQRSRLFVVVSAFIVFLLAGVSYLLVAWWLPNQKMTDLHWWQNASQVEIRNTSHKILSFPIGNHHDAFLALEATGNAQSVTILINSLKWAKNHFPP